MPILCTDSHILRAFFSKSTFHQSIMTSSIKLPYFKNAMSDFYNFCTNIELKEQPFRKYQKLNFDLQTQLVPFNLLSHILLVLISWKPSWSYQYAKEMIRCPPCLELLKFPSETHEAVQDRTYHSQIMPKFQVIDQTSSYLSSSWISIFVGAIFNNAWEEAYIVSTCSYKSLSALWHSARGRKAIFG